MHPGYLPYWLRYIAVPIPICRRLFRQAVCLAFAFALAKAGNSMAARIAMIAITTNNSINVNPPRQQCFLPIRRIYCVFLIIYFKLFGLKAGGGPHTGHAPLLLSYINHLKWQTAYSGCRLKNVLGIAGSMVTCTGLLASG
jgi:hypothetical protein